MGKTRSMVGEAEKCVQNFSQITERMRHLRRPKRKFRLEKYGVSSWPKRRLKFPWI
jgi:hypothetical protein